MRQYLTFFKHCEKSKSEKCVQFFFVCEIQESQLKGLKVSRKNFHMQWLWSSVPSRTHTPAEAPVLTCLLTAGRFCYRCAALLQLLAVNKILVKVCHAERKVATNSTTTTTKIEKMSPAPWNPDPQPAVQQQTEKQQLNFKFKSIPMRPSPIGNVQLFLNWSSFCKLEGISKLCV